MSNHPHQNVKRSIVILQSRDGGREQKRYSASMMRERNIEEIELTFIAKNFRHR